jgi:hypothetical protein
MIKIVIYIFGTMIVLVRLLVWGDQVQAEVQDISVTRMLQTTTQGQKGTTQFHFQRSQSSEIDRNNRDLAQMVQDLILKTKNFVSNFRSQRMNQAAQQTTASDTSRAAKERTQQLLERQRMLKESQKSRMQDLKEKAKQLSDSRRNMTKK